MIKIKKKLMFSIAISLIIATMLFYIIYTKQYNLRNNYKINTSTEKIASIKTLTNDSFIYINLDNLTIYRHYFKNEQIITIDSLPNFVMGTKFSILQNNILYFYVTTLDEDSFTGFNNILYQINLNDNTLKPILNDTEYLPGTFIFPFIDNQMVSLKTKKNEDNIINTFIEIFDINNNIITSTSEKHIWNDNNYTGSMIINCCTYNNYIYALINEVSENGESLINLKIFDSNFNTINTIKIEDEICKYLMTSRIGEITIFKDFIFMRNYSGNSIIGIIENNKINVLTKARDIDISLNHNHNIEQSPMFFIRYTNKCILLDIENKKLNEIELNLEEPLKIKTILTTEKNIFIDLFNENSKNYNNIFFIPLNNFQNTEIKISNIK